MRRVFGPIGSSGPGKIGGAADDHEPEGRRQAHDRHVGGDELPEPNAGVEALLGDVDEFLARGDLELDVRIGFAKRGDHRLQDQGHYRAWDRQPQQPRGPTAEVARRLARRDELLEGGSSACEEPLAGFSQADAAGRPGE